MPNRNLIPQAPRVLPVDLVLPRQLPRVNNVPQIQAVPRPPVMTYNPNVHRFAQDRAKADAELAKEKGYRSVGGLRDPNDPFVLNSYSDALFNRQAKEKRYGSFAEALHAIPILGDIITAVPAVVDVGIVQPWANIFKGDFKAFGINMLTMFTETMDVLANPVKSLVAPLVNQKKNTVDDPKYQLPWYERLGSAFGFTEHGRYNYDYDTGNFLGDLALEMVSDPVNAILLLVGVGKSAASGGAKGFTIFGKQFGGKASKTVGAQIQSAVGEELGTALGKRAGVASAQDLSEGVIDVGSRQLVTQTMELGKSATSIAQAAKGASKQSGSVALRNAAQNLDDVLRTSKGLVDDKVKTAVTALRSEADTVIKQGTKLSTKARNSLNQVIKQADEFGDIAVKTLDDLLKLTQRKSTKLLKKTLTKAEREVLDSLTKQIKKGEKVARKAIKKGGEVVSQEEIQKQVLKNLLDSPEDITKYRNLINWSDDLADITRQISITDYLNAANAALQESRMFNVMRALDKLAAPTAAIDKWLLRGALMGSPVTQGIYFAFKFSPLKRLGARLAKLSMRKLESVTNYFNSKRVVGQLMLLDAHLENLQTSINKINMFAPDLINVPNWEQQIARSIYDENWAWLRGFGDDYLYTDGKPRNLLLHQDELAENLKRLYPDEFSDLVDDEILRRYRAKFDDVGQLAATGSERTVYDIDTYIKNAAVNEQSEIQLRQLFNDMRTMTNTEGVFNRSGASFLRAVDGVDTSAARKTAASALADIRKAMPEMFKPSGRVISIPEFKQKFAGRVSADAVGTKKINDTAQALQSTTRILDRIERTETLMSEMRRGGRIDPVLLAQTEEQLLEFYSAARHQYTLFMTNMKEILDARALTKGTPLYKTYRALQKQNINSFAFGNGEAITEGAKKYIEIKSSQQYITQQILRSTEFNELINHFRPGGQGHRLLDTAEQELKQRLLAVFPQPEAAPQRYTQTLRPGYRSEVQRYEIVRPGIGKGKRYTGDSPIGQIDIFEFVDDSGNVVRRYKAVPGTGSENFIKDVVDVSGNAKTSSLEIKTGNSLYHPDGSFRFGNRIKTDKPIEPPEFMSERQTTPSKFIYTPVEETASEAATTVPSRKELIEMLQEEEGYFHLYDYKERKPIIEGRQTDWMGETPEAYVPEPWQTSEFSSGVGYRKGMDPELRDAITEYLKQMDQLDYIRNTVQSVDAYAAHLSLVEQSTLAPGIREAYLDTLHAFQQRGAGHILKNFEGFLYQFRKKMDSQLYSKFMTHRLNLEYFGTKLLKNPQTAQQAQAYLRRAHTAINDAEFVKLIFETEILPTLAKQDADGKFTRQWLKYKDRRFVYFDFETTGLNSGIDEIYEIGIFSDGVKQSFSHNNFDQTTTTEAVRRQLAARGTEGLQVGSNESDVILRFYGQLRALEAEGKQLAFVGHNSLGFDNSFLRKRVVRAMENAQAAGRHDLVQKLNEAKRWFDLNMYGQTIDTLSELKALNNIPSTAYYADEIERLLRSIVTEQSANNADLVHTLTPDLLDAIKNLPGINLDDYRSHIDAAYDLFRDIKNQNKSWLSRIGVQDFGGNTTVIDGDIYKPKNNLVNTDRPLTGAEVDQALRNQEIYIQDQSQLLDLQGDTWYYQGKALPENVRTANDAVRFLQNAGQEYAPSWRALNQTQQLTTFPVMIEGRITLQAVEGMSPIAFKNYIDTDLVLDYFRLAGTDSQIHVLTQYAKEFSSVLSRIQNARLINEFATEIHGVFTVIVKAATDQNHQILVGLKENLNLYQKYAILVTLLQDTEDSLSPIIRTALRRRPDDFRKIIWQPSQTVYKKSTYVDIFDSYDRGIVGVYNENYLSKNEIIERLDRAAERSGAQHAVALKQAFEDLTGNVYNTTKALKEGLDKHKIYSARMQRYAVIGQHQVEMHDAYKGFIDTFKTPREVNTFWALESQVGNNLDDMLVENVLNLTEDGLNSFVHHQGKGIVVVPIGQYLKDTSVHNIDLKNKLQAFLERYHSVNNKYIQSFKVGDDLILMAKNYRQVMKSGELPYQALRSVDYVEAFNQAYGVPSERIVNDALFSTAVNYPEIEKYFRFVELQTAPSYWKHIASNTKVTPKNIMKFAEQLPVEWRAAVLDRLQRRSKKSATEFLYTHYNGIMRLQNAQLKNYETLQRMSMEVDSPFSAMGGGYGRVHTQENFDDLLNELPAEIRDSFLGGEPAARLFDEFSHGFNFSTLGRASYRRGYEKFATSSIHSIYADTYKHISYNLGAVSQYAQFYYEDSPYLIENLFQHGNDSEVLSAIQQSDNFVVSYMGFETGGDLPKVIEFTPRNVADVKFAINQGAVILPTQTHASVTKTINNFRADKSSPVLKAFHKISYRMKMAMLLMNPGFVFRNLIDSTLKNLIDTRDPLGMASSYIDAMQYYRQYGETVQMLFGLNPKSPFNPETLDIIFSNGAAPMDRDLFLMVHDFLENGPSAGSIKKIEDFHLAKAKAQGLTKTSPVSVAYDALMQPTKQLEQITRLSEYVHFIKKGLTHTDAYAKVVSTHFDYAAKNGVSRMVELIIPFYSFQVKNFEYWLKALVDNPVLAANLGNFLDAAWNWDDIDFERIQYYESQLNHIMQANLQLNQKGLTLKLNPSMMDPLQLLSNPIDALSGRVTPVLQPTMDALQQNYPRAYDTILGTILGAGLAATGVPGLTEAGAALSVGSQTYQRQRAGQAHTRRSGSPLSSVLPSVFGSVRTPQQYGRASYTNRRAYMDSARRVPRRVNLYNRMYTDTGKNRWKIRMLPIDAATVQYRIRDAQNPFR